MRSACPRIASSICFKLCLAIALLLPISGFAANGSGVANISPDSVEVGTVNDHTLTYQATESLQDGAITVKVPAGFTLPTAANTTVQITGGILADRLDLMDPPVIGSNGWGANASLLDLLNHLILLNPTLSADSADKIEGSHSLSVSNLISLSLGGILDESIYKNFANAQNWAGYTDILFWVKLDTLLSAKVDLGNSEFVTANCNNLGQQGGCTPVSYDLDSAFINININLLRSGAWTPIRIDLTKDGGITPGMVKSYGLRLGTQGLDLVALSLLTEVNLDCFKLGGPGALPDYLGDTVTVDFLNLDQNGKIEILFNDLLAPEVAGDYSFLVKSKMDCAGPLTAIGDSPDITVTEPFCGDNDCNNDETCATCSADCGACPPSCGDGSCNNGETCSTCPGDCGACTPSCGDDDCNGDENCSTCAADCGACPVTCGNGSCDGAETCQTCPGDCGTCAPFCGDATCNNGEDCSTCSSDCGHCPPVCGDGSCNGTENCSSCATDCGNCPTGCGDDACNNGEDCSTCAEDCGSCPPPQCGNGTCSNGENCSTCSADCGVCPVPCGDGTCNNGENCLTCSADCGTCPPPPCGNGVCDNNETCTSCSEDCGACPNPCGDGECNNGETCSTCAEDCGECPNPCGNGTCENAETCNSCSADCGTCGEENCGDGECNNGETCLTCTNDCGACPINDCTVYVDPQGLPDVCFTVDVVGSSCDDYFLDVDGDGCGDCPESIFDAQANKTYPITETGLDIDGDGDQEVVCAFDSDDDGGIDSFIPEGEQPEVSGQAVGQANPFEISGAGSCSLSVHAASTTFWFWWLGLFGLLGMRKRK